MKESVLNERILNKFPSPYNLEHTPYVLSDFSEKTRRKCLSNEEQNQLSKEWLKVCKVIVIGDAFVGKSSLVNRFCRKFFDSNYKSTIGVDFEVEKFLILGIPFILQIVFDFRWDTAGQERFKSIAQSYYKGAHVILIAFDLTNSESLSNSNKWLQEALNANTAENPFIFLVGTKLDLLNHISYKNIKLTATKLAKDMNAEFWAISSKTGKNVDKLFCRIAALGFDELIKTGYDSERSNITIGDKLIGTYLFLGGNNSTRKAKKSRNSCCNS